MFANGAKTDYYSNNPLYECLVCSRQVSSNRYATHLEKCMGAGNKSTRKGSTRNAKTASTAVTQRILNTNSRSASPSTSSPTAAQKKQGSSSPAPQMPAATSKEKQSIKSEKPSTPLSKQVDLPHTSVQGSQSSHLSKGAADASYPIKSSGSTPQADSASAAGHADDEELFDDADFASGFSVSVRCTVFRWVYTNYVGGSRSQKNQGHTDPMSMREKPKRWTRSWMTSNLIWMKMTVVITLWTSI